MWGIDFVDVVYLVRVMGAIAITVVAIGACLAGYLHYMRVFGLATTGNNSNNNNNNNDNGKDEGIDGGVNRVERHDEAPNHRRGDLHRNKKKNAMYNVFKVAVRLAVLYTSVSCFAEISTMWFEFGTGFKRSRFIYVSIAMMFTTVFIGELFPQSRTWPALLIKACILVLQNVRALLWASVTRVQRMLGVAGRGVGAAIQNMLSAIKLIFWNVLLAGQDVILSPLWAAAKNIWAKLWTTGAVLCTAMWTTGSRILIKLGTTLWAIRSGIVDAIGLLKAKIVQRWENAGRDNQDDEEQIEAPEPVSRRVP